MGIPMVALHNKRLTQRELFRGILWKEEDIHRFNQDVREQLIAEGMTEPELSFAVSKRYCAYASAQPSFAERQRITKICIPFHPGGIAPERPPKVEFTKEELLWLQERLEGTNDPIGGSILAKLDIALNPIAKEEHD